MDFAKPGRIFFGVRKSNKICPDFVQNPEGFSQASFIFRNNVVFKGYGQTCPGIPLLRFGSKRRFAARKG
jgi:hypothetical protein